METCRVNLRYVVSHGSILNVNNYVDNLAIMISIVHECLDVC